MSLFADGPAPFRFVNLVSLPVIVIPLAQSHQNPHRPRLSFRPKSDLLEVQEPL